VDDGARPEDPPAGVACFDPTWPGAYPFGVARPELAAPLLDGIRPHSRLEDEHLHVTVSDDDALAAALLAVGAALRLDILYMEGPLG
jgi:hypothetical protein